MYKTELLYNELVQLERNNTNGKVDHPDGGRRGSKDQADALCGAVYTASKHADEYAYDYGENLEQILNVNTDNDAKMRRQMIVDFEQELHKLGPQLKPVDNDTSNDGQYVFNPFDDVLLY